jgi:hypothetical protein
MAITYVANTKSSVTYGTSFYPDLPSGWQDGDMALLNLYGRGGLLLTTPASGWTQLGSQIIDANGDSHNLFWRRLQSGDSDPQFVYSGSGSVRYALCAAYRGARGLVPGAGGQANANSINAIAPAIVSAAHDLRVVFSTTKFATEHNAPTGWTKRRGSSDLLGLFDRADTTTNPGSVSVPLDSNMTNVGWQLTLQASRDLSHGSIIY